MHCAHVDAAMTPPRLSIMALLVAGLVLTSLPASARQQPRRLAADPAAAPIYFPASCQKVCKSPLDFHVLLPPAPDASAGNPATQWGTALLVQIRAAVQQGTTSPPFVARMLAVYSTAVYDAVAVLSRNMKPVHATPDARQPGASVSKAGTEAAVAGAAYTAIINLLPQAAESLNALRARVGNASAVQAAYTTGVMAAIQVLKARTADGFAAPVPPAVSFPTPPPFPNPQMSSVVTTTCNATDITFWQQLKVPTVKTFTPATGAVFPPASYASVSSRIQGFLAFQAAFAKPFSAPTASDLVGDALTGPNTREAQLEPFTNEMNEVLSMSATLDDVNKTIAELWADGPDSTFPPGHWYRLALEECELRGLTLSKTVVLLLALGNALQDAGIAAWSAKARWYSSRPITALQCLHQGEQVTAWRGPYLGVGTRDGGTWQPYQPLTFVTPPFPGYISGHSTFSAAAARVLTRFFNNDKIKGAKCFRAEAGSSTIEPKITQGQDGWVGNFTDVPSMSGGPGYAPGAPVVLCWDNFQEAARQSGISRLHGGIHVAKDNVDGLVLGEAIGHRVVDVVDAYAPGNL